jgi:dihydroneopterin aldolase
MPGQTIPPGRRVFVRGLVLPCQVGVTDAERDLPQPVRIDVVLTVDESEPVVDDDLSSVFDYRIVLRLIEDLVREPVRLLETLAERIATDCLSDRRVRHARVGIDKPSLLPGEATIGIEIERLGIEIGREADEQAPLD